MNREQDSLHRIVVVGGGAGGLELVTRLGQRLGRRGKAHVTLIEKARTHFWKPHLHEIAAGSMDINSHAIDYLAQSHWHGRRHRARRPARCGSRSLKARRVTRSELFLR